MVQAGSPRSSRSGKLLVLINRRTYLQCAFLIPKGTADEIRAQGIEAFRNRLHGLVPELDGAIAAFSDMDEVKLLSVALDRLTRWNSGGVGINVAVQDAVVAANVLAAPLARGDNPDPLLPRVQQLRARSVHYTQKMQKLVQDRIIWPILQRDQPIDRAPLPVRLIDRVGPLQRVPAKLIGLGIDRHRPHIESPDAYE